tara:strand:+ start:89 stop:421 length:333 start_codon:yes stop_codon:yes gene_type:complete
MKYNVERMQVLSGIKSQNDVMVESTPQVVTESTQDLLAEEKIRRIIREEIAAYLREQKAQQINTGFANGNLSTTMGFAGPGFQRPSQPQATQTPSKKWQPTLGFAGPGFM